MAGKGGTLGNQNAAKGARWREAIERAINAWPEAYDGGANDFMKGINAAAHAFVKQMMTDGDIAFFREFGDRLDGKSRQQLDIGGQTDNPLVTAINIRFVKSGEFQKDGD